MKNILPLSSDDFSLFQELLIETSGLFFEESRSQSLHLALWQRLQHRGYDSYREYYNLLKFHPEGRLEIRELLDLITIGETYFFRNKAQFDVLMKFVLPEIMQRKMDSGDKWLRVWSAGCSGGDETYSIAMAMMEVVPSYQRVAYLHFGHGHKQKRTRLRERSNLRRKAHWPFAEGILGQVFQGPGHNLHSKHECERVGSV